MNIYISTTNKQATFVERALVDEYAMAMIVTASAAFQYDAIARADPDGNRCGSVNLHRIMKWLSIYRIMFCAVMFLELE